MSGTRIKQAHTLIPVTFVVALFMAWTATADSEGLAIRGATVYTMSDAGAIQNGIVLVEDGVITAVGPAGDITIPADYEEFHGPSNPANLWHPILVNNLLILCITNPNIDLIPCVFHLH